MNQNDYLDAWGDNYMKTHVVSHNKFWHICWNLFRRPFKSYKLLCFTTDYDYHFCVCFGIGEFVVMISKYK